ncbi:hypothetical protein HY642_04425 [Candidatus Woesearchaeota archaeon]|nr:hypothetical protein [Candidatus Woesearchaeota archaeon]
MKELIAKSLGIAGAAIMVLFLVLSAARVVTWTSFWMAALILAGVAYWVLPALRKE